MSKQYYSPTEIAGVLGVSAKTIYNMVNDIADPLPSYKFGQIIRIDFNQFQEWVGKHENKVWEN